MIFLHFNASQFSQKYIFSSGSQRRVSVVKPETAPIKSNPIPLSPGYNTFNKRIGEADAEVAGLGGRPRSLEFGEGEEVAKAQPLVQPKEQVKSEVSDNKVEETKEESRRRRSVTDANGNQILSVRRVRREASEEEDEEADIQTERIIQV